MADKKSKQHQKNQKRSPKHNEKPAQDKAVAMPNTDLEIKRGRPSLVDPNPEIDPGEDEGNLSSNPKVPGGLENIPG